MQRGEIISSLMGLFGGALFGGLVAWLFTNEPAIWPASLTGAFFGLCGAGSGPNVGEGTVLCVISLTVLVVLYVLGPHAPHLWWIREPVAGTFVGAMVAVAADGAVHWRPPSPPAPG